MVCLDPHYCQAAVDMSKDDFPTQVNNFTVNLQLRTCKEWGFCPTLALE